MHEQTLREELTEVLEELPAVEFLPPTPLRQVSPLAVSFVTKVWVVERQPVRTAHAVLERAARTDLDLGAVVHIFDPLGEPAPVLRHPVERRPVDLDVLLCLALGNDDVVLPAETAAERRRAYAEPHRKDRLLADVALARVPPLIDLPMKKLGGEDGVGVLFSCELAQEDVLPRWVGGSTCFDLRQG